MHVQCGKPDQDQKRGVGKVAVVLQRATGDGGNVDNGAPAADEQFQAPDPETTKREISMLKDNGAAGKDRLPSEHFKYGGEKLALYSRLQAAIADYAQVRIAGQTDSTIKATLDDASGELAEPTLRHGDGIGTSDA